MLKKTKSIIAACLVAQSFLCFILSLIYMKTKKGFSKTCAVLGLAGGVAGGALLFDEYRKELEKRRELLSDLDYEEDYDDFFIDDEEIDDIDCSIQSEDDGLITE